MGWIFSSCYNECSECINCDKEEINNQNIDPSGTKKNNINSNTGDIDNIENSKKDDDGYYLCCKAVENKKNELNIDDNNNKNQNSNFNFDGL